MKSYVKKIRIASSGSDDGETMSEVAVAVINRLCYSGGSHKGR